MSDNTPASEKKVFTYSFVSVVAGLIFDDSFRLLMNRRPAGKSYCGLWEFPGGKTESWETPEEALSRELYEELRISCSVANLNPAVFVSHSYPEFNVLLMLYTVYLADTTEPVPAEGQEMQWFTTSELENTDLLPANKKIIPVIQRSWHLWTELHLRNAAHNAGRPNT